MRFAAFFKPSSFFCVLDGRLIHQELLRTTFRIQENLRSIKARVRFFLYTRSTFLLVVQKTSTVGQHFLSRSSSEYHQRVLCSHRPLPKSSQCQSPRAGRFLEVYLENQSDYRLGVICCGSNVRRSKFRGTEPSIDESFLRQQIPRQGSQVFMSRPPNVGPQ